MLLFICGRVYNNISLRVHFSMYSVVKNLTTENTEVYAECSHFLLFFFLFSFTGSGFTSN